MWVLMLIIIILVMLPRRRNARPMHHKNPYYEENDLEDEPLDGCDSDINFYKEDDKLFEDFTAFDDNGD